MEAQNRLLPEWFNRIRTGQLRLPRFQRFEAWGANEVSGLVETVLRGLPAGATLILQVGDKEQFVSRGIVGAPDPTERINEHLLDGQQRLTALWRSMHDQYEDRTYFVYFEQDEEHGGAEVPRVWGVARWIKNDRLYPVWADDPAQIHERGCIPLKLLRSGDLGSEIGDWCDRAAQGDVNASRDLERIVMKLRERVATYNVPYLSLPVTTPKDVALDVFIKLNTSSVKLTAFDIVVAQVEAATGQSLHQLVGDLVSQVPAIEHYVEPEDIILSAAAMRDDRAPTQKSFELLDYPRLVDDWQALVDGIKWTVQCLEDECIFDATRLPSVAVLPVLAALHQFVPEALDAHGNARILLRKYLWRSFFTGRYENAAGTRALQDLRGLRAMLKGVAGPEGVPLFDDEQYPLPPVEELLRIGWPKARDILARGILALSLKAGAVDFADGRRATRESIHSREYHHLFPDSLLTKEEEGGLPSAHSYRALNCALITWNTNRKFAAKEPLAYLRERTEASSLGEDEIRSRLNSHVVPFDQLAVGGYSEIADVPARSDGIRADYEAFLIARAELMLPPMQALCDGKDWPRQA